MTLIGAPAAAARYAKRVSHTARNVAEVVRFGGLDTEFTDEALPEPLMPELVR